MTASAKQGDWRSLEGRLCLYSDCSSQYVDHTLLCLAENQALWVGLVALGPFLTCTLLDVAIW